MWTTEIGAATIAADGCQSGSRSHATIASVTARKQATPISNPANEQPSRIQAEGTGDGDGQGWRWAVPAFVRTYPCQTTAAAAVYAAAAAVSLLVLPDPLVGPFAGGRIGTWLVGLLAMVPMAPIWTSLYRFVILGDTCRHYWPPDRRSLRVLVAQVILSAITATGALPFAVFVDFWPRLTIGTRWIAALLAGLSALRLLALWLSLRLAIAPHVGAAGKSRPFLESSFVYSGGAVLRMFAGQGAGLSAADGAVRRAHPGNTVDGAQTSAACSPGYGGGDRRSHGGIRFGRWRNVFVHGPATSRRGPARAGASAHGHVQTMERIVSRWIIRLMSRESAPAPIACGDARLGWKSSSRSVRPENRHSSGIRQTRVSLSCRTTNEPASCHYQGGCPWQFG